MRLENGQYPRPDFTKILGVVATLVFFLVGNLLKDGPFR